MYHDQQGTAAWLGCGTCWSLTSYWMISELHPCHPYRQWPMVMTVCSSTSDVTFNRFLALDVPGTSGDVLLPGLCLQDGLGD